MGPKCNHKYPYKTEKKVMGRRSREREKPRAKEPSTRHGKKQQMHFPLELLEGVPPPGFQTSGLQICERVNFCCFKSQRLW